MAYTRLPHGKSTSARSFAPVDSVQLPSTLLVIELSPKCSEHAALFLLNKLRMPHDEEGTGAGLVVKEVHDQETKKIRWMHVTANIERLLEAAEWHEIRLPDFKDGLMREFTTETLHSFVGAANVTDRAALESLLTDAERRRLVQAEIMRLRAGTEQADTNALLASDNVRFHPGQSIVQKMLRRGLIMRMYPIHEKNLRQKLYNAWVLDWLTPQPISRVREYFGEQIALYFAFLGYYNYCLLFPAVVGVVLYMLNWTHMNIYSLVAYAACNIFFVASFLESWKRNSNELTYRWGTIHRSDQDDTTEPPRAAFKGDVGINPITGRHELVFPSMHRIRIIVFVTTPLIIVSCLFAFWLMLLYFEWEAWSIGVVSRDASLFNRYIIRYAPTTVYSVVVAMLNLLYRAVATKLNDKENWRSQSDYEKHLVIKLLIFDFFNNFVSLFYIAFFLQDFVLLRRTLLFLIIVSMTVNQIPEIIIPYIMNKFRLRSGAKRRSQLRARGELKHENLPDDTNFEEAHERAIYESTKEPYFGSFDDLAEIYVQFGYVFMFSSVYPVAAALAVAMNAIELRSDAYKLCKIHQRPFSSPVAGIGIWQTAFEFLGLMAVMTNCALIALSPTIRDMFPNTSDVQLVLTLVLIEHVLVAASYFIASLIPGVPTWVAISMAKVDYQSRQALKRVRALRSSVRMTELMMKSNEKLP